MIYIPLVEIKENIPANWFTIAEQALAEVSAITDPQERAQAINNRARV